MRLYIITQLRKNTEYIYNQIYLALEGALKISGDYYLKQSKLKK